MTSPFQVELSGVGSAPAVRVAKADELRPALEALGLHPPRPTVVVVGGAAGLEGTLMERLRPVFAASVVPVMQQYSAVGVDGGTHSGVMRLLGEARAAARATFPLVGVVAAGTVQLPRGALQDGRTVLESNHTHFVIVPGEKWGAEAPWIARTATCLAGTAPSITLLANGGKITYSDLQRSVEAGRPVIVIAGSGRTADVLVRALVGAPAEERATALVESGLIQAVSMDDLSLLSEFLVAALSGSAAE